LSSDRDRDVNVTFTPNHISIPPYGIATSEVHLNVMENATIRPYSLPILANIYFPTSIGNYLSNERINNTSSAVLVKSSNFTVTALEKLGFSDQLNSFLTTWFNPITGAYSAIVAIVSGALGWKVWKKRKHDGGNSVGKSEVK
jgi:hypothetical protein